MRKHDNPARFRCHHFTINHRFTPHTRLVGRQVHEHREKRANVALRPPGLVFMFSKVCAEAISVEPRPVVALRWNPVLELRMQPNPTA